MPCVCVLQPVSEELDGVTSVVLRQASLPRATLSPTQHHNEDYCDQELTHSASAPLADGVVYLRDPAQTKASAPKYGYGGLGTPCKD